jgi:hypothetical protein
VPVRERRTHACSSPVRTPLRPAAVSWLARHLWLDPVCFGELRRWCFTGAVQRLCGRGTASKGQGAPTSLLAVLVLVLGVQLVDAGPLSYPADCGGAATPLSYSRRSS